MIKKECSIEGCGEFSRANGYCIRHYNQIRRHGEIRGYKGRGNEIIKRREGYSVIVIERKDKENATVAIDDNDIELVSKFKCYLDGNGNVVLRVNGEVIYLKNLFCQKRPGHIIKHLHNNKLDCRRDNLFYKKVGDKYFHFD